MCGVACLHILWRLRRACMVTARRGVIGTQPGLLKEREGMRRWRFNKVEGAPLATPTAMWQPSPSPHPFQGEIWFCPTTPIALQSTCKYATKVESTDMSVEHSFVNLCSSRGSFLMTACGVDSPLASQ